MLRYLAHNQAAIALHRSITIGNIEFNPYDLRLSIAGLNVSGRDGSPDFFRSVT